MAAVRAKFKLTRTESMMHTGGRWVEGKWENYPSVEKRTLVFKPVYDENPESENHKFWEATPDGEIKLGVINPEAWEHFELDQEYYVEFVPAHRPLAGP